MRPPISAPSSSSSQNPSSPAPPSPSSLPPTAPCLSQAAVASSDQMPSLPSPMKKHNGKKINAYTGYREIRSCHYCNTPGHLQMNCRQKIMDERIAKDSTDDDDTRQAEAYLASKIADPDPLPIRHEDGTVHWQGENQASTSTTAPQRSGGCRPLCLARAGTLGALLAPTEHCGDASPLEADPMSDSDGPPPLVDSSSESDDPDIIAARRRSATAGR